MASTRPKIMPTQRVLKERVAVTTNTASRGAPNDGAARKSLFSKIKMVVAPPSKILRHKDEAKVASAISRDVPAQEHAKTACSKDKDATRPSKIPRLKRAAEYKGVSIFTKFKRVMGISKIPRLKRDDQHSMQGVPSPTHSICRGDPFAAHGDSFYNDKRASIVAVTVPVPVTGLATKPAADVIQAEAFPPPATMVFPPVRPLNIVKKRPVVPVQPNVPTPRPYMDDYPRPRKPVIRSDADVVQVRTTGLPPNYCVAGARYHTPHTHDARKVIPVMVSSKTGQLAQNNVVIEAEYNAESLLASGDAVPRPHTRQSIFSKMKQSIRKSARAVFKPATSKRTCAPAAPVRVQSPIRPSVGRTTTFVVDVAQSTPSAEDNSIRKPTIFLSPARKAYRPRGSIPPISGLMMPDKSKSAHGICQLRRQGKATGLVCICYKKFMKSRQKFANHAPAILSDIIEDRPVAFFPRRRSFNLDTGARYLLSLYLDDEGDLSAQNVSQLVSGSGILLASSPPSLSVSNDSSIRLSPSVSVSSSSSVSTLDQSLDHVLSPMESVSLSASDHSLDNVSSRLEDSINSVSLSVSENDIEPVTSSTEDLSEPLSLSPSVSILDENLESVLVSPSYSILDAYFDNTSRSSSPSLLSLTESESPESTTPPIEGLTGGALDSLDSVAISSEFHTARDDFIPDVPLDDLKPALFDTKTLSKKNNRSARILPSTPLGLGINLDINDNEHFCPATIQRDISVDAIDECRLSSPAMKPKSSRRLGCYIPSINTSASSSSPSIMESNGSTTTRSQDNGDVLSSFRDTSTSPSSVSSVDPQDSRSRRAAIYGGRLPIGVAPSLPSRRVAIYGSVSPRQRVSPVSVTSSSLGSVQPLCFVDALNSSAMQYESVQRPVVLPAARTSMTPTSLALREHNTTQYASPRRTKRHGLVAPLPF